VSAVPARVRRPRRVVDDGRLKTSFADNVGIPLAGARRLKPCPRKATVRSGEQPTHTSLFLSTTRTKSNESYEKSFSISVRENNCSHTIIEKCLLKRKEYYHVTKNSLSLTKTQKL